MIMCVAVVSRVCRWGAGAACVDRGWARSRIVMKAARHGHIDGALGRRLRSGVGVGVVHIYRGGDE
jgi:hypothetical protein